MAGSVTFILKDPQATVETPIYLVFWYGETRLKLSTGEKTHPNNWNKDAKGISKARETKDNPEGKNINTRLKTMGTDVMNTVREHLTNNGNLLPEKLRAEIKNLIKPSVKEETEPVTFFRAIEDYIKTSSKAKKTIVSYQSTLTTLEDYNSTLKKDLTFEDINMDFYENFVKYLNEIKKFAKNTIAIRIKNIKVFMNYANDKGYTDNQGHKHRNFKKVEETAETIYLNDEELSILYNLDLKEFPKFDRVRDLFLIGCYTGLRFSDLSQLTPDKITDNETRLKIKTMKTGETVIIPLHGTIRAILKKYNGEIPRAISNQKFNDYLKEIGDKAKIKEQVVLTKTKGGLSYESTFKKYQLITVHTARRSFATNMFLAGVPTISIMKITGHKTERAFMKYIKISQEQNADLLAIHPYFNQSPLKVVNK